MNPYAMHRGRGEVDGRQDETEFHIWHDRLFMSLVGAALIVLAIVTIVTTFKLGSGAFDSIFRALSGR